MDKNANLQSKDLSGNTTALYICLMNSDRRSDLDIRMNRLLKEIESRGWHAVRTITERVDGPDSPRPRLLSLLSDPSIGKIVVECQEQISKDGYPFIEAALQAQGRSIVLIGS